MEQYVKGFQRFHAGEDVRPVTSALASFYHLFQVYYKVRQLFLLQSATAFLLQSATSVIIKCDRYYKVRQYTCDDHGWNWRKANRPLECRSFLLLSLGYIPFISVSRFFIFCGTATITTMLGRHKRSNSY